MKDIRKLLKDWYTANKRELPWRDTTDSYTIWVSEIILQQTQVKQGLPYFERFISKFPTIEDLAKSPEEDILKIWQGLGYYSRARNMHTAAKQVMTDFNGIFPTSYDQLTTLKGIGDYTASAVSSFSSGEQQAAVDGNVIRVISRLFNIDIPHDTAKGKKAIKELANELLDKKDSGSHNQAIMEFGALQCTPKSPNCTFCPMGKECIGLSANNIANLPVKSKKITVKNIYHYYFILEHNDNIIIQKRTQKGIWQNLYEFPLFESDNKLTIEEAIKLALESKTIEAYAKNGSITISNTYTHLLSHRKIEAIFVHIKSSEAVAKNTEQIMIKKEEFDNYPISRLTEKYWEDIS
jgi:A/G-specific adenine glycosylase